LTEAAQKTQSESIAKDLIDLVFLSDGAYAAALAAILARDKEEKDLLFINSFLPHLNRVFSESYINYVEKSLYQKDLTFLPNLRDKQARQTFFKSLHGTLESLYTKIPSDVDTDRTQELDYAMALTLLSEKKQNSAIPFLVKSLEGAYRQNAQRLLVHVYMIEGDRTAAWHVFSAMHRESPRAIVTENARYELKVTIKDTLFEKLRQAVTFGARPVLISPAGESAKYAAAPAIIAILAGRICAVLLSRVGGLGLLPQGFMIIAAVMLAGAVFTYHHETGEQTAAIITGLNIMILPLAVHLNFVWYAVFAIATAYLIHASINLFAFLTNMTTGKITIPYGEIETPEKLTQAIVHIAGIDEKLIEKLSAEYPDIEFIHYATATSTVISAEAGISQFLIDMSPQDLEKNIDDIVKYVRKASFIQQYPYEAGLDSVAVRQMNMEKLEATLITLKNVLSPEAKIDNRIDAILSRNLTPAALRKQENIAMEGSVEDELIKSLPILKANSLIPEKQAVVYDLRDVSDDVCAKMLPAIKRMSKADENVYACLIDPKNRFQKTVDESIFCLTSVSGETPVIDQARDFLIAKLKIDDFPLASISVVTTESRSGDYMKHIESTGIEKANFVITGKNIMDPKDPETEHIQNMLPAMALMGIVKRSLSQEKRANIIAVDCSENILTKIRLITDIVLRAITRLNINDEITDEISAIILTARSV